MDDFLTTLVSRTLGHHQSLQPRRASRFESEPLEQIADSPSDPDRDTARRIEAGQDSYTPSRAAQDDDEAEPDFRATRQHVQMEPQSAASSDSLNRDGVIDMAAGAEVRDAGIPAVEHLPIERVDSRPGHPARSEGTSRGTPPSETSDNEKPLDTHVPPPDLHDHSAIAQSHVQQVATHMPGDSPGDAGPGSTVDEWSSTGAKRQVDREKNALPDRSSPRFTTRIAAPDEPGDPVHDESGILPGPRITVSIGRIEVKSPEPVVRATPASTPSRYEPRLTLGEYLERTRRVRR